MTVYETKTVRIHHPDQGVYVYLMVTRFNGENHLLADEGWRGTYQHYAVISRNENRCVSGLDAFKFIQDNKFLQGSPTEEFVKDLDMGRIEWSSIEDEDLLSPSDIGALATENVEPEA